ncbi:unnamed protein product (macronuclear) [Paramecium tetraurelia]|uniref:B box-type domain-containing protein n=1 Tax=Paramecium tetraurelia TaxID=5888 RepID=A0BY01_PARTE|nr:uncharacterized protein GSPATT00033271001 [Paramecium tetraurelia]CAK63418.1 unnamed protein product [Paramecium tetraurelia]|eukprot:XP_001430816.1 hypothetical protein (macronuclear) [Paramecium tetraurelia strain d4-2]
MIEYPLQCQVDGHEFSPVLGCCKCRTCKNLKPYCQYCIIDFHAEHLKQLQPLSKIPEWIQQKILIQKSVGKYIREISMLAQNLDDMLYPLYIQSETNLAYLNLKNLNLLTIKLLKIDTIETKIIPKLNDLMTYIEALNKEIKTLDSTVDFENQTSSFTVTSEQRELTQRPQENLQQESNLSGNSQQKMDFRYTAEKLNINFTKQNLEKVKKISIDNGGKIIKSGPDFSRLIICEPEIPNNLISRFALQILKHKWVCVGACHKSIIQKQKNDLNLCKIGHGAYLIENSGSTYSHLDKEVNNTEHPFKFFKNDIIIIEINMKEGKIIWRKQSNLILWKMTIDTTLDLHPCVHIFNSKVQIIDEY